MAERAKRLLVGALGLLVLTCAASGFAWLLMHAPNPTGPVPIVWDKTSCAHCRMQIGDPSFAAQLQTEDGHVLDFDDPGCLFELLAAEQPKIGAIYFHHSTRERWLARDEVGFVPRMPTPMGYGLAAVERTQPGALDFDQAAAHVRAQRRTEIGAVP